MIADWLLRFLVRGSGSEFALGDLEEAYRAELGAGRTGWALRRWYLVEALVMIAQWYRPSVVRERRRGGSLRTGGRNGKRRGTIVGTTLQDVRYALRGLNRRRGFAAVVVITLAIGIGATSVIYSVVDGVLIRALPYSDAGRLVALGMKFPGDQYRIAGASVPNLNDWRELATTTEDIAGATWADHVLLGDGPPERVAGGAVTETFFTLLRSRPHVGRLLDSGDYFEGSTVAVISHRLWQRRFGGDPAILGRTLPTRNGSMTVVGVAAPGFDGPEAMGLSGLDVWTPFVPNEDQASRRGLRPLAVIGRLAPDATLETARAEFDAIGNRLAREYPDDNSWRDGSPWSVGVNPLQAQTVHRVRQPLVVLFGAVGLLLSIACVNVANLFLARSNERGREMSLRTALGAGRGRIVRQLLTESVVIALIGGAAGVGLAYLGMGVFKELAVGLPRIESIRMDARVLFFALGVSITVGIVFGLIPALRASRADLGAALKSAGGKTTDGTRAAVLRQSLVALETATALVLLVGAGLLFNSLVHLYRVEPGFNPDGVYLTPLTLDGAYESSEDHFRFFDDVLTRVRSHPGITGAAAVLNVPMQGTNWRPAFVPEGTSPDDWVGVDANLVTPGYFETMGIPVLRGRTFETTDDLTGLRYALANETAARTLWPGVADPIGQRFRLSTDPAVPSYTLIGIVGDAKQIDLAASFEPMLFAAHAQHPWFPRMHVVARGGIAGREIVDAIETAVWSVDRDLPIPAVTAMTDRISGATAEPRFYSSLIATFATIAMVLAAVGVYGTMAYTAAQRTREMGIRMALGAPPSSVKGMLLREGMTVTAVGIFAGLVGASFLTNMLARFMFEVSPTDPATFAGVAFVLAVVAWLACYLPARRAAGVDPVTTLRNEG